MVGLVGTPGFCTCLDAPGFKGRNRQPEAPKDAVSLRSRLLGHAPLVSIGIQHDHDTMFQKTGPSIRRIIWGTNIKDSNYVQRGPVQIKPEIEAMLAQPSWSVRSLLPPESSTTDPRVSREQLHHLLKLSALPRPKSKAEETKMLQTLDSQIHFVKEMQKIDTTNVEPLIAIRDETAEHVDEQKITLETLRPYLEQEEKVGTNGTVRRRKPTKMIASSGWDPFELGDGKETRKKGKFFFVRKEKAPENTSG
ncbi:hypothetical protein LTS08_004236 [Lithohypha guttulata]|nr:hypothetical protein LTS08_004236 [Lithohypha guttulata]